MGGLIRWFVLGWLQGEPSKWKPFVANRTKSITEIMKPSCWRYVKSEENPADAASRGISASQMKNQTLWWQGPQLLQSFDEKCDVNQVIYTTDQEVRSKQNASKVNCVQNNSVESIIVQLLQKFSSINKIIRIVAWLLRAFKTVNFRKDALLSRNHSRFPSFLTLHELRKAKLLMIKYVQRSEFIEEIKLLRKNNKLKSTSHLLKLNPFIDSSGILRVGGRLSKANLNMEMKHPAILPNSGQLTTLLIRQAHQLTFHSGPRLTLFTLRQKYWVIGGTRAVKRELKNCVICRKQEPKIN